MADNPKIEDYVEIYNGVSELKRGIEDLSLQIDEMLESAGCLKGDDEIEALLNEIKAQKNNQEGIKKRFYESMTRFCQSHDHQIPEVFMSCDEGFEAVKEVVEGLKKEEDDVKERMNQLMVKFANSKVSADSDVGGWTAVERQEKGSSMAAEIEADLEVYEVDSELEHAIEDLSRKIDEILMGTEYSEDVAEMKAFWVEIKIQKYIQEGVKKRFNEFKTEFCGSHDLPCAHVFKSTDERYRELKAKVQAFKKKEDDIRETINQLMIKIGTAVGGQEKYNEKPLVRNLGMKEADIIEAYVNPDKRLHIKKISTSIEVVMGDFEEIEAYLDTKKELELEEKMSALMLAREALLEKDEDIKKKSLMEWIKDFEGTGSDECKLLEEIKDRVVKQGIEVCCVLGVLMFRVSHTKQLLVKFHEFKSFLESLGKNKYHLMVAKKAISSLEIAEEEVRKMQKQMLKIGRLAEATRKQSEDELKRDISEESQIDKLLLQIFHEIYRLDWVLNNPGLLESKQYKEAVDGIDKAVKKLKQKCDSIFEYEELNNHTARKRLVKENIKSLWSSKLEEPR